MNKSFIVKFTTSFKWEDSESIIHRFFVVDIKPKLVEEFGENFGEPAFLPSSDKGYADIVLTIKTEGDFLESVIFEIKNSKKAFITNCSKERIVKD